MRIPAIQRQLWFADKVNRNPAGYLIPIQLRITGGLDVEALRRALTEVVTVHEVLRTSVTLEDDELVGVLRPPSALTMPVEDIDRAELDATLAEDARQPLDVTENLPMRARLIRVTSSEHVLCLAFHHMVFDGGSRNLLYEQLQNAYAASAAGRPTPLMPLEAQYRELVMAREAREDAPWFREQLGFWRDNLAGLTPFELPPDRPRPARRAGTGAIRTFELPGTVSTELAALARRCRASLYMVLVAACQVVLARHSGRTDVTVGSTCSTRDEPEFLPLIGLLVNMVVLRGDTSGDPTFTGLVARVRDLVLDAHEAREVPFATVVRSLGGHRDAGRIPLFGVLIDLVAQQRRKPVLAGLEVTELPQRCVGSKYDLSVTFDPTGGPLRAQLGWDVALYEDITIERVAEDLRALLVEVCDRPDVRLSALGDAGAAL